MYSISCFSMLSLWHSDSQSSLPQNMHSVQIFQNLFRLGKKPLQKFLFKKKQSTVQEFFKVAFLLKTGQNFLSSKHSVRFFQKLFLFLKKMPANFSTYKNKSPKIITIFSSHIDKRGKFSNLHFQISAYTVKMILVVILLFLSLKYRICKCNFR